MAVDANGFEVVDSAPKPTVDANGFEVVNPEHTLKDANGFEMVNEPKQSVWDSAVNTFKQGIAAGAGKIAQGLSGVSELIPADATFMGQSAPTQRQMDIGKAQRARSYSQVMQSAMADPMYQTGARMRQNAESMWPVSEANKDSLPVKVADAVSGFVLPVVSMGAAPATIALQSYGDRLTSEYQKNRAEGMDDNKAAELAFSKAGQSGAIEGTIFAALPAPLRRYGSKLVTDRFSSTAANFVARRAAGAAEGAIVGGASAGGEAAVSGEPVLPAAAKGAGGMAILGAAMPYRMPKLEQPSLKQPELPDGYVLGADGKPYKKPTIDQETPVESEFKSKAALNAQLAIDADRTEARMSGEFGPANGYTPQPSTMPEVSGAVATPLPESKQGGFAAPNPMDEVKASADATEAGRKQAIRDKAREIMDKYMTPPPTVETVPATPSPDKPFGTSMAEKFQKLENERGYGFSWPAGMDEEGNPLPNNPIGVEAKKAQQRVNKFPSVAEYLEAMTDEVERQNKAASGVQENSEAGTTRPVESPEQLQQGSASGVRGEPQADVGGEGRTGSNPVAEEPATASGSGPVQPVKRGGILRRGGKQAGNAINPAEALHEAADRINQSREWRESNFGKSVARGLNALDSHAYELANALKTGADRDTIVRLSDGGQGIGSVAGNEMKSNYDLMLGRGLRDAKQNEQAKLDAEKEIDVRSRALSLAASGMPSQAEFQAWAHANWDKPGVDRAAYTYALSHWTDMEKMRGDHYAATQYLLQSGRDAGLNIDEKDGYVPQVWEQRRGRDLGRNFNKSSEYGSYHEGINNGEVPQNLDIRDLMQDRTAKQMQMVEKAKWVDAMRDMESPVTNKPIVTDMESGEAPKGYVPMEIIPGKTVAVDKSFAYTVKSVTEAGNAKARALNNYVFGFVKHGMVGFDTYHLGRLFSIEAAYGKTIGYKNGVTCLNYDATALREAVQQGLVTPKQAEFALRNQVDVKAMVGRGLQATRIADAIYRDFVNSCPVVKDTAGRFQRFLFDKFQRGATVQVALKNLERLRDLHPEWTAERQYRQAVDDTNLQFRSFGKQGWFKNSTFQDMTRMVLFAPQWTEGLIRGTAVGYKDLGKFALNVAAGKPFVTGADTGKIRLNMGNQGAGAVVGTLALAAAGQVLNWASTGHATWANPEGHKMDIFIPSWSGGPGYWLNPMTFFYELTHDATRYYERNHNLMDVAKQIAYNKLHPVPRGAYEAAINKDFYGRTISPTKDTLKRLAHIPATANPIPLLIQSGLPTGEQNAKRDFQQQVMQSFGVKTQKDSGSVGTGTGLPMLQMPQSPMSPFNVPYLPLPKYQRTGR